MDQDHLTELDLAGHTDGASESVEEHLRWCSRCQGAAAEYRWLEDELTKVLAAAGDAGMVPRPKWWTVSGRLALDRRRLATARRASVLASVVLSASLLISCSGLFGPALAAGSEPVVAPAKATVPEMQPSDGTDGEVTPTVDVSGDDGERASDLLVVVLPPTPTESGV